MSFSLVLKVFIGFICLWLASSAADSVPFPKEPMTTNRDDRIGDTYVLAFINYTYRKDDGSEQEFSAEKARYGEGRILNVQGHLVHVTKENNVSDNTACSENIRGFAGNPLSIRTPWIALIRRGQCTFDQKIKHVFQHGAAGAIIYNEEASNSLEKMKIIDKDRNITAVFTFKWIGEEMAKIADEGHPVWVSISEGARGLRPLTHINKTSVLFVSISFIILMVISLVWLIFYYIQRFRYLQSKDQQSRHLCSVAKRIIMKIPTKNGRFEEKDNDCDCCAICIENYKQTDCIRVLPCRHEFHKNCVDPWLLEHRTCPMCKLDVLKYYGFVFLGSEESILQLDLDMEIGDNGALQRRNHHPAMVMSAATVALNINQNNHDNDGIVISPTLHSFHQGLYIYGNRQRSASLQPLAMINGLKELQRSHSSNSRFISRPKITHSISHEVPADTFENRCPDLSVSSNANFLDIPKGAKKRQRSKSADACYLNEAGNYLMKFALANKNLNNCVENELRNDDSMLLASESTAPVISEPADLPTNQCNIKIQIVDDDE